METGPYKEENSQTNWFQDALSELA